MALALRPCLGRPLRDHDFLVLGHSHLQLSFHQVLCLTVSTQSQGVAVDQQGQVGILGLAQKMLRRQNHALSLATYLWVPEAAGHTVDTIGERKGGELPCRKLCPVVRDDSGYAKTAKTLFVATMTAKDNV